ncbi:hypothetical protein TYRP_017736 [Tyrophagus putrescentiae]|nr:hypothetical protein TYRP_017736 [Tyrophagus putrescentiae]
MMKKKKSGITITITLIDHCHRSQAQKRFARNFAVSTLSIGDLTMHLNFLLKMLYNSNNNKDTLLLVTTTTGYTPGTAAISED